jgi:hypothetical protein
MNIEKLELYLQDILIGFFKPGWSKSEVLELINNIKLLETSPEIALGQILIDKKLKDTLYYHINLQPDKDYIVIYETITSKSMLNLIINFKELLNGKLLQTAIINEIMTKINEDNKYEISMVIYQTIYDYIDLLFDNQKEITSIVFKSDRNSEKSEFIEDLRLSSYEQIIENFDNFSYFSDKDSASQSLIFSADLKDSSGKNINSVRSLNLLNKPKVFFKIYIPAVRTLETEKKIYEELFKLVKYNVTPNIICKVAISNNMPYFYTSFVKKAFPYDIKHAIKLKMKELIKSTAEFIRADPDMINWELSNVIITQKGDMSFSQLLKSKLPLKAILFQLIYTLSVFDKIQFCHGDLHNGNIFVNKSEKDLYYMVNKTLYKIPKTLFLKIYDFDHSSIFKDSMLNVNKQEIKLSLVKNTLNDFGVLDIFNKNLDKVRFMLNLKKENEERKDQNITDFINEIFPGLNSKQKIIDTYKLLLFDHVNRVENLKEANRLFGIEIKDINGLKEYRIHDMIFNSSWEDYFKLIYEKFGGLILKTIQKDAYLRRNHLWIPDEIILPSEKILQTDFFKEYETAEPMNIRKHPIYTFIDKIR